MATRDRVIEMMVKPTSCAPSRGRLHAALAHFHMADDIFQHDDGVIHHETDRQGQRHQRHIIEAVAEQVHNGKGADDRHRQGHAGNDRGGDIADEEERSP